MIKHNFHTCDEKVFSVLAAWQPCEINLYENVLLDGQQEIASRGARWQCLLSMHCKRFSQKDQPRKNRSKRQLKRGPRYLPCQS